MTDESRASIMSVKNSEEIILKHLQMYIDKGICPLAGSSVYVDRMFLQKHMPIVDDYLHYRTIDTSTILELIR